MSTTETTRIKPDPIGVHLSHCDQGEYLGVCKYGDPDCPAISGKRVAESQTTEPLHICMNCRWWAKRQDGVGWCDFRYPQEVRGMRRNTDTCNDWEGWSKCQEQTP
jgi:hypothetical protein